MEIVIATKADIDELTQVEIESKQASIPGIIEAHDIDYPNRHHRWVTYFNAQSPASSKPERLILKAVSEGKIIGYIAGHLSNRHKDAEIENFYVLRQHQREGIGTALLSSLVDWIIAKGAKSLCVGFLPQNRYKAFYLKYGGEYLNHTGFIGIVWMSLKQKLPDNYPAIFAYYIIDLGSDRKYRF